MNNLAYLAHERDTRLGLGNIKAVDKRHYIVESDIGLIAAERSAGCLLDPEVGDRVFIVCDRKGEAYILDVLKRNSRDTAAGYSVDGNMNLSVRGRLNVTAEDVDVAGTETAQINAPRVKMSFLTGTAKFGDFAYGGGFLSGRVNRLKTVAQNIEIRAERIMERFKRQFIRVDEIQESKIGWARYWIRELFSVRSKNTTIRSREQVKVDGEKIKLG